MIFPKIEVDPIVQVKDKIRISASKSYISKDEDPITKVEIEPDTGDGFIDVTGSAPLASKNWYLDWEYDSDGTKTISIKVTTTTLGPVTQTITKDIEVLDVSDDKLFSQDSDLIAIESDILKYVPQGRATFNYIHREAQSEILEWLYTNGYLKSDGTRFDKDSVIDIIEFKYWSKYLALRLIYKDLSNAIDDIMDRKARDYENTEKTWRSKAILKIDVDGDGTQGVNEGFDLTSRNFIRE